MFRQIKLRNDENRLNMGNVDGGKEPVKQRVGFKEPAAPAKRALRPLVNHLKDKKAEVNQVLPKIPSVANFTKNMPQSSSCVSADIFDDEQMYLLYLERARLIPADFLSKKVVTSKMRAILFDWLVQIQDRFSLAHETLHLGWILVDHCLASMTIKKDKLQLLGATCMFLATKYEEVVLPHINDFVFLSASAFNKKDLTSMEREVFRTVNFNMGFAYPIHFLRRYRYVLQNNDETHQTSKLFCDLFMSVYETYHKLPSVMAQVALYLAFYISGRPFPENAYDFMGTTEKELKSECSDFVGHIHNFCSTSKDTALHRKYRVFKPRLSKSQLDMLMTLKRS